MKRRVLTVCAVGLLALSVSGMATDWSQVYQVEDADVTLPAEIIEEHNAIGGKCVRMSSLTARELAYEDDRHPAERAVVVPVGAVDRLRRGTATLAVESPVSGQYWIWCRVRWQNTCSRQLNLDLIVPAPDVGAEPRVLERIQITSAAFPQQWHWLRLGQWDLPEGRTLLQFVQNGHLALADAVAISTNEGYTPPGYLMPGAERRLEGPPSEAVEKNGVTRWELCATDASRYEIGVTIDLSKTAAQSGRAGIRLDGEHAQPYELLLSQDHDGGLSLVLEEEAEDAVKTLLHWRHPEPAGSFHSLVIAVDTESIGFAMDGYPPVHAQASTANLDRIHLIGDSRDGFVWQEFYLNPLQSYVEVFSDGLQEWKQLSGSFRRVDFADGTDGMGALLASGAPMGILAAPWTLREPFRVAAQVRPLDSEVCGLVFGDWQFSESQRVVLKPFTGPEGTLALIESRRDGDTLVWEAGQEIAEAGWSQLDIDHVDGRITVISPSVEQALQQSSPRCFPTKIGLFVGEGSALFGRIEASEMVNWTSNTGLFEPECAGKSFSYWYPKAGAFEFLGHPAVVRMQRDPSGQDPFVSFRHPLGNDYCIRLSFGRFVQFPDLPGIEERLGVSPVRLPMLRDDAMIRLIFEGRNNDADISYELWVDARDLRFFSLWQEGRIVAQEELEEPFWAKEREIAVTVKGRVLTVSRGEQLALVVDDFSAGTVAGMRVGMRVEHLTKEESLDMISYTLEGLVGQR